VRAATFSAAGSSANNYTVRNLMRACGVISHTDSKNKHAKGMLYLRVEHHASPNIEKLAHAFMLFERDQRDGRTRKP
jgi:hypothetical protein